MTPFTTFTLIFIATILLLIAEIEHRAVVALVVAVLTIYFGTSYGLLNNEDIIKFLNIDTVLLLVALLILFESLKDSGLFEFLSYKLIERPHLTLFMLNVMLVILALVFSLFLFSGAVIMITGAITLELEKTLDIDLRKTLIIEAIMANFGGILLPIGAVPNIIVVTQKHISFMDYVKVSVPLMLTLIPILILYISKFTYKELRKTETKEEIKIRKTEVKTSGLFYRAFVIFILFIITIFLSDEIGMSPTFISYTYVAIMLFLGGLNVDKILSNIDWSIPIFAGGMFIFVGGLERAKILSSIGEIIKPLIGISPYVGIPFVLFFSALVSAFIDNIPVVLILMPIIDDAIMGTGLNPMPYYWALIIGANLGGNITTFGSIPTLTATRMAERAGRRISTGFFTKISTPLTLLQLSLSAIFLIMLTLIGFW